MQLRDIVQKPLITEKSTKQREKAGEYFFAVHPEANKHQIREAVETFFKVDVVSVRTMRMRGKSKRYGRHVGQRPDWKKAIVRLKENQTIKIFEGT